jgi:hypothetical protein
MSRALFSLLFVGSLTACRAVAPKAPLSVESVPSGTATRLVLHASSGLKVNARLAPVLELGNGIVVRFHSDRLTPDSAYFAEPPFALVPDRQPPVHGTLRASVCDSGATVCRAIVLEL